jgi:hypothetical protein
MMGDVNTPVVGMGGDVNMNVLVSMVHVNTKAPVCVARALRHGTSGLRARDLAHSAHGAAASEKLMPHRVL